MSFSVPPPPFPRGSLEDVISLPVLEENTLRNGAPAGGAGEGPVSPHNAPSDGPLPSFLPSMTEQTTTTYATPTTAAPSPLESVRSDPSPAARGDNRADDTSSPQNLQQMVENCVAQAVAFSLADFREEMQHHIDIQIAYLDGRLCGLGQLQREMSTHVASQFDQHEANLESFKRDTELEIARIEAMLARLQTVVVRDHIPQTYLRPSASTGGRASASTGRASASTGRASASTGRASASTGRASASTVHPSAHEGTRTPLLEHAPGLPLADPPATTSSSRFTGVMSSRSHDLG
ncbi:hypothetical protein C8T65DRAFT_745457 [Cerioporus squamosus]|nr:hypothetical protein C8T65DRAFT_745457 [Cerioporus squamosus]